MKFIYSIFLLSTLLPSKIIGQIINTIPCAYPYYPTSIALDSVGNVYISQPLNNRILKFTMNTCTSSIFVGTGVAGYSGDGGPATSAQLNDVNGLEFDKYGNLFIADYGNNVVRKVDRSTGLITTVAGTGYGAGTGAGGHSGDGGLATLAELNNPRDIALDDSGNIYISDQTNCRIRKVTANTGIITTVAGSGSFTESGNGGPAISAGMDQPESIAIDSIGNLYILDLGGFRRVTKSTGIIDTYIATGTYSGDGGLATAAGLGGAYNISFDNKGNLYIADGNRIRKVDVSSGIINTIVDIGGGGGFGGDGGLAINALLDTPQDIAFDAKGNIYLADRNNSRIRVVYQCGNYHLSDFPSSTTPSFTLTTNTTIYSLYSSLADSARWYWGDGTSTAGFNPSHTYSVSGTYTICMTSYYACGDSLTYCKNDSTNSVNVIAAYQGINSITKENNPISIYPNPTSDQFFIDAQTTDKITLDLFDVHGRHLFSKSVSNKSNIDVTSLNEGIYTLTIKAVERVINKKLIILR